MGKPKIPVKIDVSGGVKQTQEQWIRGVLAASVEMSPDKQTTIDNGIESLRREPGHKLDEPCPPAARIGRATVDP